MTSPTLPPPLPNGTSSSDNAITSDNEITAAQLASRLGEWLEGTELGPREESSRVPQDQSDATFTSGEQTTARLDTSEQQGHENDSSSDNGEYVTAPQSPRDDLDIDVNDYRQTLGDAEDSVLEARRGSLQADTDDSVVNARVRSRYVEDSVVNARIRDRYVEDSEVNAPQRLGFDHTHSRRGARVRSANNFDAYGGRPQKGECFICYSRAHNSRTCPQSAKTRVPELRNAERGECFICYEQHMSIHCPYNWINRPGGSGDGGDGVGGFGSLLLN
ncbi:hypothetical protein ONS95_000188 [Cadophora gregata]|uniref:uncharacterized protein n=1 Tax=Cadophora gregata TaxID=51156 RepID=UPI0026DB5BE6|nr:uncharacterized protein ONS95_000188 [Cadophora gregata]KAK0115533.1 hypothetical protein ONS96_013987 [Cadophora gregata f. sp. sojae]KAK0128211.1 hypothetical protein ONS95_000188 [Cadophora gregata]